MSNCNLYMRAIGLNCIFARWKVICSGISTCNLYMRAVSLNLNGSCIYACSWSKCCVESMPTEQVQRN